MTERLTFLTQNIASFRKNSILTLFKKNAKVLPKIGRNNRKLRSLARNVFNKLVLLAGHFRQRLFPPKLKPETDSLKPFYKFKKMLQIKHFRSIGA
jgi:hypothetical protein